MKKSLIALAVVGLFSASAFAATGNVDAYGKLRVGLASVDGDFSVYDGASRLGFKGSEDIGGGLKGLWQIETGLTGTTAGAPVGDGVGGTVLGTGDAAGSIASRNTFIGLSGGFGTVLMGRHDTPYKLAGSADVFGDTPADAQNNAGIIGNGGIYVKSDGAITTAGSNANGFDQRLNSAIAYISPDFSGFHAAVAIAPGTGAKAELTDMYSLALVYANGPLKLTAGYEDHNNAADEKAWKINGGYKFGDFGVGATFEEISSDINSTADATNWLLSGTYGMGPITLAAQYGDHDSNGFEADFSRATLGAIYSLSKRTNAAFAYSNDDIDGGDSVDAVVIQLNHDF